MAAKLISEKGIAFRLFGFPVLYRWSALALPALFGLQLIDPSDGLRAIEAFAALALAIAAAVIVHELGHALTARAFGATPRIEVVFFGGLTYYDNAPSSNGKTALISVAGSVSGALAAVAVALVFSDAVFNPGTVWESGVRFFVFAGAIWGIFNLVPLPGLDGSHILDAGVRAIAPKSAPVIVPVTTAILAVAAIGAMYVIGGTLSALWLVIIFGPQLVALPQRIRQGREQPLLQQAHLAEQAYRRGELEKALTLSKDVLGQAESTGIRTPMIALQRAALSKLGRAVEVLDLDTGPGVQAMPTLMRARALASVGRLAEAESDARQVMQVPEAAALVAELLVAQDIDARACEVVTPESAMLLARRVAVLEPINPTRAKRLAQVVIDAGQSSSLAKSLAGMALGSEPQPDDLEPPQRWLVEVEWAARTADPAAFEQAMRTIPDPLGAYLAQERLHLLGRYDQAARIGSVAGSDAKAQYLLARSFARTGHIDRAIEALDAAVSAGWGDAPETVTEPDLVPLHSRREWSGMLERMAAASQ